MTVTGLKLGGSPLGSARVRLSWQVFPGETLELLRDGADQGDVLVVSEIAILEDQPLGKRTYRLIDRTSGVKSNIVTMVVT
jgi:hypothetical protein